MLGRWLPPWATVVVVLTVVVYLCITTWAAVAQIERLRGEPPARPRRTLRRPDAGGGGEKGGGGPDGSGAAGDDRRCPRRGLGPRRSSTATCSTRSDTSAPRMALATCRNL